MSGPKVKYLVNYEAGYKDYRKLATKDCIGEAVMEVYKHHNLNEKEMYDYRIFEVDENGHKVLILHYRPSDLDKVECKRCGKQIRFCQTVMTRDCNGIPYRRVCEDCNTEIYESNGYDGEYYDSSDEQIEEDY